MSLDALIEAIRTPVSPAIIELSIADIERQSDAAGEAPLAAIAAPCELPAELPEAEIVRLDTSSKRTFRRRYRKLCERTRDLVDRECRSLPRSEEVAGDLRGEAYYHDAEEHFANSQCGYCLLEVLHDGLRESRCDCVLCNGLRDKHLHYTGACSCAICRLSLNRAQFDASQRQAGRYVIPVTEAVAAMVG